MKKFISQIFVFIFLVLAGNIAGAKTWTVNNANNLPSNPGMYTTIQAGINAASAGDTVLVTGSLINYNENPSISKQITLIGAGFNPQYNKPSIIQGIIYLNTGCNGTTIMGFEVQQIVMNSTSVSYSNITIYGCLIYNNGDGFVTNYYNYLSNFSFIKNVFYGDINLYGNYGDNTSGMVIRDNIFCGQNNNYITNGNNGSSVGSILVDHNLFYAGTSSSLSTNYNYALQLKNATVTNNIFYSVVPIDTNNGSVWTDNSFTDNITYASTTIKSLPWGSNSGTGNINNSNPMFTAFETGTSAPYMNFSTDNLKPQTGSPVINAANDGTNIGPTGGVNPVYNSTNTSIISGEPPLPEVETITLGSTGVPQGTSLNVNVRAKKIN